MIARHGCLRIVSLALIVTITLLLTSVCGESNHAIADGGVRSLQYIETSGPISTGPRYVLKVTILDGCLRRRSMRPRPKEGFSREEPAAPDSHDFFEIYDARNGKRVYVFPDKREFVVVKGVRRCSGSGQYWTDPVIPDPGANFDEFLRRPVPVEKATELPERIVDGKRAIGFLVARLSLRGMSTTTYWVDPTTQLPIRIEDRHQPIDPDEDGSESIRRNIIFDAPIDRSLFDTDPPAGYTVLPDADY